MENEKDLDVELKELEKSLELFETLIKTREKELENEKLVLASDNETKAHNIKLAESMIFERKKEIKNGKDNLTIIRQLLPELNKSRLDVTILNLTKEALELSMRLAGAKTCNYFDDSTQESRRTSSKVTTITLKNSSTPKPNASEIHTNSQETQISSRPRRKTSEIISYAEDSLPAKRPKRKVSEILTSSEDTQMKFTPKREDFQSDSEKSKTLSSSSKIQKYWFYDISNLNIEDEITPVQLFNDLIEDLRIKNIGQDKFSYYVLSSSNQMSNFKRQIKNNPELNWNNLAEIKKAYFKLMYAWLKDKDAYQKLLSKDMSIIKGSRNSTPKIEKKISIENKVKPIEIATKLKVLIDENNINKEAFVKNVLNKHDTKILNDLLDETNDWHQLSVEVSNYFKEIYKWMSGLDDKKMNRLNENNNRNSSIKIEFDDSVNLKNNISSADY